MWRDKGGGWEMPIMPGVFQIAGNAGALASLALHMPRLRVKTSLSAVLLSTGADQESGHIFDVEVRLPFTAVF